MKENIKKTKQSDKKYVLENEETYNNYNISIEQLCCIQLLKRNSFMILNTFISVNLDGLLFSSGGWMVNKLKTENL